MLQRILLLSVLLGSLSVLSLPVHSQEALCAEVKIEILQELTMERQGFEALMRITNSLDSFALENVSVTVSFADANGNPVVATSNTAASDAAFFIRIDDTRDITGLQQGANGLVENGSIAPKKVGELRWLIIPTANAAGQIKDGKLYFVGAQLRYSYGGKEEVVDVAADTIVVKPQPALTLDYFLTKEIIGDDAFTSEIEAPVPYTLGVRINNSGYGYAKAVKIESAQPTITENKLGLAVDFKILGSYLADQPSVPTLLINFGTIEPQAVSVGRWIMETNLAGKFTAFTASFTHADELGGALTSLLQAANAHFLVRDVQVALPGRDGLRDFLADNAQGDLFVYESENTGLNHALCNHCAAVTRVAANLSGQGTTSQFTHAPVTGFSYAKVADPYSGTKVLARVIRADGTVLNPRNAWLSKERAENGIAFSYFINVFDSNSSGSYTLYWGGNLIDEPQAPVIQHIVDRITHEGGSVGFLVKATDPNETLPNLSVKSLPTGASFTNQAANTGVLQWNPAIGQAGVYTLTFVASDGGLTSERSVTVRVNPDYDSDGDGLDDQWERDTFGNLDQDGTGDFDGDGRNDLQEYTEGTDAKVAEMIPGTPQILSPIFNADTLDASAAPYFPALSVTNGNHGTGIDNVAVIFEVYGDEGLTELLASASVNEGTNTTSVQLDAGHLLENAAFADNRLYYWRARARDNTNTSLSSAWVKSRFFINSANDSPSTPNISSPAVDGIVADVSPELSVTNAADLDRDRLYYRFVVYEENNLTTPLAEAGNLPPGNNGQTRWRIPKILQEDKRYLWQVTVTDEHGLAATSEWGGFLVSTANHAPTAAGIDFPVPMGEVTELEADNSLAVRVINAVDPERAALVYEFELDTVNTFDSAGKQVSASVAQGQPQTTWTATNLQENTTYFWRVRASDGSLYSPWVVSEFTVSALNEAPSAPVLQNPVSGSVVANLRPLLEVNPATDPEGGPLSYRFELYANADLTGLIATKTALGTSWALDVDLTNTSTYYWRARAEDAQGLPGNWSSVGSFTVTMPSVNEPPQMSFVLPSANTTVENHSVLLQWVDSDPDSSASISLFRQINGGEPVLIVANIGEDLDGEGDQYLWNTTGLAQGDYSLSAVIADEDTSVTVNLCCVVSVPEDNTGPNYLPGLSVNYYGYQPSLNGGIRITNLSRVNQAINTSIPDAGFIATRLDYGPGLLHHLGREGHVLPFLRQDAASFSGSLADTNSVILHMTGNLYLPVGSYNLRVRADDGYSIRLNGNVIAEYNGAQQATTRVHALFNVAEAKRHDFEVVYWDESEAHEFKVELSADGGASYVVLDSQALAHLPKEPGEVLLIEPETVAYEPGLKGTFFGYHKPENNGLTLGAYTATMIANSNDPTAVNFIASYLRYGPGINHLGMADHLQQFLGVDATSLSGDPRDTDSGVITMKGRINLAPGIYNFRVKADDGYRIHVNGGVVAEFPQNQSATSRVHNAFNVYWDKPSDIDILYWDAGASSYELGIELSIDGGASYQYLSSDILSNPIYQNDLYLAARAAGSKIISDRGGVDKVSFGSGVTTEQLWFSKIGSDLKVTIIGTQDGVRIKNWYLNQKYRVESFELNNGQMLAVQNVQALVDAMAPLAPPALGETTLSTEYLNTLQSVIQANWN